MCCLCTILHSECPALQWRHQKPKSLKRHLYQLKKRLFCFTLFKCRHHPASKLPVWINILLTGELFAKRLQTHLFGQLASFFRWVQDLVKEDGIVEGETEPDGVSGLHLHFADFKGLFVSRLRISDNSWECKRRGLELWMLTKGSRASPMNCCF